jgi:hypothetical protein
MARVLSDKYRGGFRRPCIMLIMQNTGSKASPGSVKTLSQASHLVVALWASGKKTQSVMESELKNQWPLRMVKNYAKWKHKKDCGSN